MHVFAQVQIPRELGSRCLSVQNEMENACHLIRNNAVWNSGRSARVKFFWWIDKALMPPRRKSGTRAGDQIAGCGFSSQTRPAHASETGVHLFYREGQISNEAERCSGIRTAANADRLPKLSEGVTIRYSVPSPSTSGSERGPLARIRCPRHRWRDSWKRAATFRSTSDTSKISASRSDLFVRKAELFIGNVAERATVRHGCENYTPAHAELFCENRSDTPPEPTRKARVLPDDSSISSQAGMSCVFGSRLTSLWPSSFR